MLLHIEDNLIRHHGRGPGRPGRRHGRVLCIPKLLRSHWILAVAGMTDMVTSLAFKYRHICVMLHLDSWFKFDPFLRRDTMPKKLVEIASEIVQTQVSLTPMSAVEIASSLRQVFSTLHELQKAETAENNLELDQPATGAGIEPAPEQKPMLTPQGSIQNDKVICLECGAEMKQLTSKHLVSHGMEPKRIQKEIRFHNADPPGGKVIDQS